MRSYFVVVAILLAMAGVVAASEQEHLPASIMRDVTESMGNAALSSAEDSIEVVNHFAPSADRSLIHAAESITHELDDKMEEASYSEMPDYIVPASSKMEEAQYTEAIDPAFLLETGAHSDLEEVELLDSVEQKAHSDAQEMDIGLIEESACQGPACGKPAPKQYVTPVYKNRPRKVRAPKPVAAPKNATAFVVPQYKPSRKHHRRHARKAAAAKPKGDGWKVAPILPHGSVVVNKAKRHAARKAKAARYITAAIKPTTPAAPAQPKRKRYCVKRNVQTKKCERRCRRCRGRKPKQYMSPSFYVSKPKQAKRRGFPAGTKVLVNTPAGPVYVLYVKKHHKPQSKQLSGLAFNQAPRAVVRAAGATYVLPHAPASPYQRDYKEIRRARRRARRAARQAQQNTVYDPKTNTVIRHIHNHHFTRASDVETTASAPTLRRAYVKLCKLQRAIMTKYNKEALPSARVLSRAARVALKYDTKADQTETEANALRQKYADHLKKYRKAQKLINRANRWLKRRGHRTSKKRSLRSRCRRAARKAGRKVPSRCARRRRAARKTSRKVFNKKRYDPITNKVRFQAMNADAEAEAETETETEAETEAEAETETESEAEAETESESEAEAETETEATTEQTAEQTAEAKAESELQTEAQDAAFSPVEGLDFNRSPLIDALIKRLDASELVKA